MDDDTSYGWLRPLPEYEPPVEASVGELDWEDEDTAAAVIALDEEGEI